MDNEINLVTTQRIALLEDLSILQARRGKIIKLLLILISILILILIGEELVIENARNEAAALDAEMNKQKKELLKRQNKAARKIQKEMRSFLKRKKVVLHL